MTRYRRFRTSGLRPTGGLPIVANRPWTISPCVRIQCRAPRPPACRHFAVNPLNAHDAKPYLRRHRRDFAAGRGWPALKRRQLGGRIKDYEIFIGDRLVQRRPPTWSLRDHLTASPRRSGDYRNTKRPLPLSRGAAVAVASSPRFEIAPVPYASGSMWPPNRWKPSNVITQSYGLLNRMFDSSVPASVLSPGKMWIGVLSV